MNLKYSNKACNNYKVYYNTQKKNVCIRTVFFAKTPCNIFKIYVTNLELFININPELNLYIIKKYQILKLFKTGIWNLI